METSLRPLLATALAGQFYDDRTTAALLGQGTESMQISRFLSRTDRVTHQIAPDEHPP